MIADGELLQGVEVTRVQCDCALQITQSLIVGASSPSDEASQFKNTRRIEHCAADDLELGQRAVVIEIRRVKMIGAGEMSFTSIWAQPECCRDRPFRQGPTLRNMTAAQPIKVVVRIGELAVRGEKRRIAYEGLVQQIDSILQILRAHRAKAGVENEVFGPAIEFECRDVCGGAFFDCT